MRNFTLLLLVLCASAITIRSNAQCPSPGGMTATPITLGPNCGLLIQFAIPNSNVSIYNNSGFVAQSTANGSGVAMVTYNCTDGPITAVLSWSGASFCNTVNITPAITLPIKLTAFSGHLNSQGVLLKWETSYELNNSKYVIEKSADGRSYQSIGEVPGSLNSLDTKAYEFLDASFKAGDIAFYRLKQVDIDGQSTYSRSVYVNNSKAAGQSVKVSNPFARDIQIFGINSADLTKGNVQLFNIAGVRVNYEISGANAISVDPSLPAGLYVLMIKGTPFKLIKQ